MEDQSTTEQESELMTGIKIKKRKLSGSFERYIDSYFKLGSAAEAERVRSVAKYILPDNRKLMEPLVFEALVFLKINRSYWDIKCVQTAMAESKSTEETD